MEPVTTLDPARVEDALDACVRALHAEREATQCWPDPVSRTLALRARFGPLLRKAASGGRVWQSGDLTGIAVWLPAAERLAAGMQDALRAALRGSTSRRALPRHGLLALLVVQAERRRQGRALALLRHVNAEADRQGESTLTCVRGPEGWARALLDVGYRRVDAADAESPWMLRTHPSEPRRRDARARSAEVRPSPG